VFYQASSSNITVDNFLYLFKTCALFFLVWWCNVKSH